MKTYFFVLLNFIFAGVISVGEMTEVKDKGYYRKVRRVSFSKANAVKTDIIYKLFQNSEDEGKILTEDNVGNENFNRTVPFVVLMHGWTTDDSSPWFNPLKEEFFKLEQCNVLHLNWSKAGNQTYKVSAANILPVGKYIAEFLIAAEIQPKLVQLIGHSLGSQLAGYVGKSILELKGEKIGRITALDPVGPGFENPEMPENERLCSNDAEFVDVIHTDIQYFGYTAPFGHVDFYPNEGRNQPGCPLREDYENCNHARSTLFFLESLRTKVKAREALYKEGVDFEVSITPKLNGSEIIFGQHVNKSARGVFYLETNAEKPFLKEEILS